MGRPREHGEATRVELLSVAREILSEQGPDALNLRDLAASAGTSTRAVYSLFGSKEGLVRTLYVEGFAELADKLKSVAARGSSPRATLLDLCAAYRAFARADPARYRLMCEQLVPGFDPTPMDRGHALDALGHLQTAVAACVTAGELGQASPAAVTLQWWAMLHGLAALEIRGLLGAPVTARRHWTSALDALYAGYARPSLGGEAS